MTWGSPGRRQGREAGGAVARAGFVNAHTHLYSALAPYGMPPPASRPENFVQILERVWWRLDRALDEKALRAGARLYAAEAALAGTTALLDHHESPGMIDGSLDVLADACDEIGIRAVLCYGATERNEGRDEAERGLAECRRFIRANRRPLVRGVVGLHASFTVGDDTLREAADLCAELGTVTHVHVAEDRADVEDARRRGHDGPLQRLLASGALPPGSVLAHGVWLSEREVRLASERGLWLVQNPRSNEHNGVGYARALGASNRVALGTDGFASDLREELAALVRLGREAGDGAAEPVLAARLEAGGRLVRERFAPEVIEGDGVEMERGPADGTPRIRTVTVAGRVVARDGVLLTADLEALRAEARDAAPDLWRRMESLV